MPEEHDSHDTLFTALKLLAFFAFLLYMAAKHFDFLKGIYQ